MVRWTALNVPGEVADGTEIDEPTLSNVKAALTASLQNATSNDTFIFLCCGHGFWKSEPCFVLSSFGDDQDNPWTSVIALDSFRLGLQQKPPRKQWLFFDCCRNIPTAVLEVLGSVGDPLVRSTASGLQAALSQFGLGSQFGMASATAGAVAFGIPGQPSRFCEMLFDALDGAGASKRDAGTWWIEQRGIEDAIRSYARRTPDLTNPEFYEAVLPISSDTSAPMRFRRILSEPRSRLIASSRPPIALKSAHMTIACDNAAPPIVLQAPQKRALVHVDLVPARRNYMVTATFPDGEKTVEVFADLPLAEPAEFIR
jgi:hypothetical protein